MQPHRTNRERRKEHVARLIGQPGWEALDGIEDFEAWDGEDLEELRKLLGPEQFEALMDEFKEEGQARA